MKRLRKKKRKIVPNKTLLRALSNSGTKGYGYLWVCLEPSNSTRKRRVKTVASQTSTRWPEYYSTMTEAELRTDIRIATVVDIDKMKFWVDEYKPKGKQ